MYRNHNPQVPMRFLRLVRQNRTASCCLNRGILERYRCNHRLLCRQSFALLPHSRGYLDLYRCYFRHRHTLPVPPQLRFIYKVSFNRPFLLLFFDSSQSDVKLASTQLRHPMPRASHLLLFFTQSRRARPTRSTLFC
jgi:hypothetical protein